MDRKAVINPILKQRFFVTPTGYPTQNGFLDYGPPLTQIKLQILSEFRKIFVDEDTYEIEPSAVLPYEVLKNSGHIDKFCDVILSDGECIVRADHYIEEKIGELLTIPQDLTENYALIVEKVETLKGEVIAARRHLSKRAAAAVDVAKKVEGVCLCPIQLMEQLTKAEVEHILAHFACVSKQLADMNKNEIDFVVLLHNLHSPNGKAFNPSADYNLIFKINDRQFLRPELAQSQFTNFRRLFDMNNERLPFSSLAIGRSYRNEISARGGMLRTKEFEQAEIEYFSDAGKHAGFTAVRGVEVALLPNTRDAPYKTTLGEAFDNGVISSEAICYFIAKAQEFLLRIGFKLDALRYRQHNPNEMAHYANDCWDVEIKTLSGWVECAGIADRSTYDLRCHAREVNTSVKRYVAPHDVYEPIVDQKRLGKVLREKIKDLVALVEGLPQKYIGEHREGDSIKVEFEGSHYELQLKKKTVDFESFVPRVIEPSFGISRILHALVEQGFNIRDERNVLSLRPRMCYLHCMITYIKYTEEFAPLLGALKSELSSRSVRFRTCDRSCSIGRKYSSADEVGVPYFITLDFETLEDSQVTIRERDSTSQIRVYVAKVPTMIEDLITEKIAWSDLYEKYGVRD